MMNNTISANAAVSDVYSQAGGAVIGGDNLHIQNNTITQNVGKLAGGMYLRSENDLTLMQNIISGNELLVGPGPVVNGGGTASVNELIIVDANNINSNFNVFGQNSDSQTYGLTVSANDIVPVGGVDTVIAPVLGNNGGDSLNHLPVLAGDAVDMGGSGLPFCGFNPVDQRGFIRPWDGDGDSQSGCDAGAIELNSVHEDDLIFKDGFDEGVAP